MGFAKKSLNQFINDARAVHGDKYDYSLIQEYPSNKIKVKIFCPIPGHGIFEQTPHNHVDGKNGCRACAGLISRTTEQFIQEAQAIHGDRFDYTLAQYHGVDTVIKIGCNIPGHGFFEQKPNTHLESKYNCPTCRYEHLSKKFAHTINDFIKNARTIHGNKYDYSEVVYVDRQTEVIIKCPTHGTFKQAPINHTAGKGCRKCSISISKQETCWLNYILIPDNKYQRQVWINFEIDNKKFKRLVDGFDPTTNTIYEFYGDYWHGNPDLYQAQNINKRSHKTFGELYQATQQREQLLKQAGYQIIPIWENDFNYLCTAMDRYMLSLKITRPSTFLKKLNLFSSALSKFHATQKDNSPIH